MATAVPGRDEDQVQHFATPAGSRLAVLFTYAEGAKPQPPFTPALYEHEGRATAAMHQAGDDFASPHHRRPLDTTYLLEEPQSLVEPLLAHPDQRRFFRGFVAQLQQAILAFATQGLDWGPVHGDLTLDNLHVTADNRIVWYDFDSGGPGWRAGDLQGWAAIRPIPDAAPRWEAFLRGYQQVRPLAPVNIEAAPFVFVAFEIWGIAVGLRNRMLQQGDEAVQQYLTSELSNLQPWAAHFGFAL